MQSSDSLSLYCPLPVTVPEQAACPFYWYFQGEIRAGMRLYDELYGLVAQFDFGDRTATFELACSLAASSVAIDGYVVISVDTPKRIRRVWLNLRNWNEIDRLGNPTNGSHSGGSLSGKPLAAMPNRRYSGTPIR